MYEYGHLFSREMKELINHDCPLVIFLEYQEESDALDIKSDYGDSQNNWSLFKGDWKRSGSYLEEESSDSGCNSPQLGDINCDQIINVIDIVALVNIILSL